MTLEPLIRGLSTCGFVVALAATGCGRTAPRPPADGAKKGQPPSGTPVQAALDPRIQSRKDKLSYAFGMDMARTIQRQKDSLNVELLRKALLDTLAGEKLVMTDEEVTSTLKAFEADLKHDIEHATTMAAARNRKESQAFFADNAKKAGVVTLPSGLQYKILKKGDGKPPAADDAVVCNYRGALLDGTEIDSSYKRKEPPTMALKSLIPGFAQALELMPVGSKWQLFIPPQLAYGDRPTRVFGPNATLVFEVELLAIKEKAAIAAK